MHKGEDFSAKSDQLAHLLRKHLSFLFSVQQAVQDLMTAGRRVLSWDDKSETWGNVFKAVFAWGATLGDFRKVGLLLTQHLVDLMCWASCPLPKQGWCFAYIHLES